MYIPCFCSWIKTANAPEVQLWMSEGEVSYKVLQKKYKKFENIKLGCHYFGFIDDFGTEYVVWHRKPGRLGYKHTNVYVQIYCSLDPNTQILRFASWLKSNCSF
jgi:hypothetical protein